MTTYIDHYWDSDNVLNFTTVLAEQPNIIGPKVGDADVAGTSPARFYISVRSAEILPTPVGCAETPIAMATALLGVWA
jgi:hypothetical protein